MNKKAVEDRIEKSAKAYILNARQAREKGLWEKVGRSALEAVESHLRELDADGYAEAGELAQDIQDYLITDW
jgi:predicted short-subunit dehydrogenase-like oxidoreductase (DUF2520 family)